MVSLSLYPFYKSRDSSFRFLFMSFSTPFDKAPLQKKEKKVFINRIIIAYFKASGAERDIKVKLTNSENITVKYSGKSYCHFVDKVLKGMQLILIFK